MCKSVKNYNFNMSALETQISINLKINWLNKARDKLMINTDLIICNLSFISFYSLPSKAV